MRKPDSAQWLYLDFDSFFASVEQLLDPALRGKPVGIVPLMSNSTCLIAASREAKVFDLKTGVSVRDARQKCPNLILRPARHDVYVKIHTHMRKVIENVVPIYAVRSIDEVACQLLENEVAQGAELGLKIKAALAREIGETLTCSIGFAPNELLAKIAAEMQKPDGLVMLQPQDLPQSLYGLKLTNIPGISAGISRRLSAYNIFDVQSLLRISLPHARKIWGSVEGARMLASLNGYVVERSPTHRCMYSHSRILPWDTRTGVQAYACARLLTIKAARRMRRDDFFAHNFSLSIKGEAGKWWGETAQLQPPAQDDHAALIALNNLWKAAQLVTGKMRIKKINVVLHNLVRRTGIQEDLFLQDTDTQKTTQTWHTLSTIIDTVREKFGDEALYMGEQFMPEGGYAGGKIAFNHIPDMQDF